MSLYITGVSRVVITAFGGHLYSQMNACHLSNSIKPCFVEEAHEYKKIVIPVGAVSL